MSSQPAQPDHRGLQQTADTAERRAHDPQGPGSNAAVAVPLGVGIGVLVFLLVLPYLGGF